jgi:hypothetical protein
MRVLYVSDPRAPDGFSYAERRMWRAVIFSNVLISMRQVITAMEEFEIDLEHDINIVHPSHGPLTISHTAITSSRRRRSKIARVSRGHISSLCKHYGPTVEFN